MIGKPTIRINFTKRALEELMPDPSGRDISYYDTKSEGLSLIVRGKGKKTFCLRGRLNTVPMRYTLGDFPDMSVENARVKAKAYRVQIKDGKSPIAEKLRLAKDITFGEMVRSFIEYNIDRKKKSWREDEAAVELHLSSWKKRKASSISRNDVKEVLTKLSSKGHYVGANRLLERIRAIYNKAIKDGWLGINPTTGIDKYKERARERVLMRSEMPQFFRALEGETNRTAKDILLFAIFTGIRKGNILSMKWEDVKNEDGHLIWTMKVTKNDQTHIVPLPSIIAELFKARKKLVKNSEYVFPGEGQAGYYRDPKKTWARILKKAEIKEMVIHDLRRTLATTLTDIRANPYTIQHILGHSNKDVTARYSRRKAETLFKALNEANDTIVEQAKGLNRWW